MLANPSAKFAPHRVPVTLTAKPFERRSVCVVGTDVASQVDRMAATRCGGRKHTHFTREAVKAAVQAGEMVWVDRHHNVATYTRQAAATWQKTASGGVHAMQMKVGLKGRHLPVSQRDLPIDHPEYTIS